MILFLSGPMSNLPDFNYPEFRRVAALLRAAGHTVYNPAENPHPPCGSYNGYLRMSFAQVLQAEAIALLDGWGNSPGANRECSIGKWIGIEAHMWWRYLEQRA